MEKDKFKKIPLTTPPKAIRDDMLVTISGGKQNRDENGNWDTNTDHLTRWYNDTYHTKF